MIYVIKGGELYKIGYTSGRRVEPRMQQLQTGSPYRLELIDLWEGSIQEEAAWHAKFARLRAHGEWFQLTDREIDQIAGSAFISRALYGYPETPPFWAKRARERFEAMFRNGVLHG